MIIIIWKLLLIENVSKFNLKKLQWNDLKPLKNKQSWWLKEVINIVKKDEDKKFEQIYNKNDSNNNKLNRYYIINADLNYYKLKSYNKLEELQTNFIKLIIYSYYFCCDIFILNNKLY